MCANVLKLRRAATRRVVVVRRQGGSVSEEGTTWLTIHPQQLKYGDKTHVLQSSPETHRYELYKSRGAGDDDDLAFAGLIHHSLTVQKAEDVTAGVDSALEQLRSSMAAISEFKQANKYASPVFSWLPRDVSSTPVCSAATVT